MPDQQLFYRTIAALATYIDRIGAKEKNFRRWMVQEDFGHYYKEKCVIKLDHDGTITCTDAAYAPTDAEQAAIRLHFSQNPTTLPNSVECRAAGLRDLLVMLRAEHRQLAVDEDGEPLFYEFYNQRNGNLIMVQQRIDTREGKRYLPWSYWSDGIWRCMEPDGGLPFWKPKQATDRRKIMVHEGAKAAKFITELCEDANSTHPWADELREYEHWGMIGGALSPHRAAYEELWAREPEVLVYVCDNDWPGRNALEKVSKNYKRKMKGIYFDNRWPPHWDMADPIPQTQDFYSETGRYIGKRLGELMRNATWATEVIPLPAGRKGKPMTVISPYFLKEWAHCRRPEVFVHVDVARQFMSEREFNSWVNPYSDVDDTAKLLRRHDSHKAAELRYDPSSSPGFKTDRHDVNFINTHMPGIIKPEPGNVDIWLQYLHDLFPNADDRKEVIRWCATLACRPNIKMHYGLLLISETQGVGKSTLGSDVMKHLVGPWNCSEPKEKDVVESKFNGWCAHKRLAVIHEIYAGHSSKAYDELKSVITEKSLHIDEKYQATYEIENWLHVIACSNSKRALKLSMDDRRWLVPAVSEEKRTEQYWTNLHNWLTQDGGLSKILWWFNFWLENNRPVERGADAPDSSAKREVVLESYSPGQSLVATFLERLKTEQDNAGGSPVVVTDLDLQKLVRDMVFEGRMNDKLERPSTLRKVAKGAGWHIGDHAVQAAAWAGRGLRAYCITNDPLVARLTPSELVERHRPLDVTAKAREYFGVL